MILYNCYNTINTLELGVMAMINNKNDMNHFPNYNSINDLSGIEFENLCKDLLQKMGFYVETTKASGDGGIDLIANNSQPFLEGRYIVQCKRYTGSVGEPIIRDLYGVVCSERANKGILMTTGTFTSSAVFFAQGKNIELIDREKLNKLINQYSISFFEKRKKSENNIIDDAILRVEDYRYKSYAELKNDLFVQPNDNEKRAKIIENLLSCINSAFTSDYTNIERVNFYREIKKHISILISHSKKIDVLEAVLMSLSMQLSFYTGDFKEAYNEFVKITKLPMFLHINSLSEYTYRSGLADLLFDNIFNVIQICCIANEQSKADKVITTFKSLINEKIRQCERAIATSDMNHKKYYKYYYDIIKNIKKGEKWFAISDVNVSDAISATYDIGELVFLGSDEISLFINESENRIELSGGDFHISNLYINNLSEAISRFKKL